MPSALELQCHAVLSAAISAELGIVLATNNPYKARASLYTYRRASGDPTFAGIHIRVSPNNSEGELWILRRQEANSAQGFSFANVL